MKKQQSPPLPLPLNVFDCIFSRVSSIWRTYHMFYTCWACLLLYPATIPSLYIVQFVLVTEFDFYFDDFGFIYRQSLYYFYLFFLFFLIPSHLSFLFRSFSSAHLISKLSYTSTLTVCGKPHGKSFSMNFLFIQYLNIFKQHS